MAIKFFGMAGLAAMVFGMSAFARDADRRDGAPSVLVVYFSKTGNTRTVAEYIHARVGGDIFQLRNKTPYPEDYRETTRIARAELDNNERPEVAETISVEDMKKYETVFLGYPNWWSTIPMAFFTFLEQHDLAGKTVIPFCTHGGSGLGRGPADIRALCPNATIRDGLAVRGESVSRAGNDIDSWLGRLGFGK